jgi:hypothetical protein
MRMGTDLQQVQVVRVLVRAHEPNQEGVADVAQDRALVGHVLNLLALDERRLVHHLQRAHVCVYVCVCVCACVCLCVCVCVCVCWGGGGGREAARGER